VAGAGGGATVGDGSCDLSCAGLIIGGTLDVRQDVYSGLFHRLRRSRPRGRELDPGSGSSTHSGAWVNDGRFNRQQGTVTT